jgi:hypothetical protein
MAMVFTGTTRYRVPWDFLLALLAAGALSFVGERVRLGWLPLPRRATLLLGQESKREP